MSTPEFLNSLSVKRKVYFSLFFIFLSSCSSAPSRQERKGIPENSEFIERGGASFYADHYAGKKTASGELYSPKSLTAAHKTLSFGTILIVKKTGSDKTVKVKVNDRGPFSGSRIIDLSRAAAETLGIIQQGVAEVEIYRIP